MMEQLKLKKRAPKSEITKKRNEMLIIIFKKYYLEHNYNPREFSIYDLQSQTSKSINEIREALKFFYKKEILTKVKRQHPYKNGTLYFYSLTQEACQAIQELLEKYSNKISDITYVAILRKYGRKNF
ncbi:MAG: hypothetical protein QXQ18_02040 [Candidatus Aenigmatarchaeota archaeon]